MHDEHRAWVWTLTVVSVVCLLGGTALAGATAQTGSDLQIEYSSSAASSGFVGFGGEGNATEAFVVDVTTGTVEIGPNESRIRVVNRDSGESVTFAPVNRTNVSAGGSFSFEADSLLGQGEVNIGAPNTPVRISNGSLDAFRGETFAPYVIQIIDQNGTVLAETEPRIHGIRYQVDIQYNGSALAFPRDPTVNENWHVELTQGQDATTVENDAGDEYFIVSTAGTGIDPTERFRITLRRNQSDPTGDRLLQIFLSAGIASDDRVNESFSSRNTPDTEGVLTNYANENGVVNTPGLTDAIGDWAAGEVNTSQLIEIINAWASGTPVSQ